MLQQLEFKLSVEKQYKEGIEKMINLYKMEGDKRSKSEAEGKRLESTQKIQLLTKSLKRYSDMHIDFEEDFGEDESLVHANMRRPLTGKLHIACRAVRDVDHYSTGRPAKSPDSFITVKVEDQVRGRTKISRNDNWNEEFDFTVEKANEIEISLYDRSMDRDIPISVLWLRISDIAEAIRRKKVEQELSPGWVSASKVQSGVPGHAGGDHAGSRPSGPGSSTFNSGGGFGSNSGNSANSNVITIDGWFVLEPVGRIHLTLGFEKTSGGPRHDNNGGLARQGAIRQKKEEIHEMHGHKFVQQNFYNIMRCALCGDFLKYSGGYQCLDCKYTCHKKCYPKVVTKCISKASTETDPDEEKLNHRIPHRFEPVTNMSANWCCHCGYMLPLGKKNVRKCSECGLTAHSQCVHLIPDFCGMSMEMAGQILSEIKSTKNRKAAHQKSASVGSILPSTSPGRAQKSSIVHGLPQAQHQVPIHPQSHGNIPTSPTYGRPSSSSQPNYYQQQPPPQSQALPLPIPQQQQQSQQYTPVHKQPQPQPQPHLTQQQQQIPQPYLPHPQPSAVQYPDSTASPYQQQQLQQQPIGTSPSPPPGQRAPVKRKEVSPTRTPSPSGSAATHDPQQPISSTYPSGNTNLASSPPKSTSPDATQQAAKGYPLSTTLSAASAASAAMSSLHPESTSTSQEQQQLSTQFQYQQQQQQPYQSQNRTQAQPPQTTPPVQKSPQTPYQEQYSTSTPSTPSSSHTASQSVGGSGSRLSAQLSPAQLQHHQQQLQQQQRSPRRPRRKVGLDDFNFLAVLGKGNFGKVMLAESRNTRNLYAIKVLKKDFIIENDEVESTRSEKRVFLVANRERHPFLISLHSCFQTENRVYFVMEYISGGDLMWHIQQTPFTSRRAQFYAAEVLLALKYFHENGVIYRDLKLDNILLTLSGHIKIADYGLCKEEMWYGNTTGTFCGTPEFMAPEILLEQKYGRSVDWWAFGVLIYQMLLGQSPFRGDDDDEVFDAILCDEPLYPIHMPRDSVSILQGLLTREPGKRLGSGSRDAEEIMEHSYFKNINFDDIYHCRVPPPFVPQIDSPTDVRNFDQEFTSEVPALTPVNSILTPEMQEKFRGFSYMNGDAV